MEINYDPMVELSKRFILDFSLTLHHYIMDNVEYMKANNIDKAIFVSVLDGLISKLMIDNLTAMTGLDKNVILDNHIKSLTGITILDEKINNNCETNLNEIKNMVSTVH